MLVEMLHMKKNAEKDTFRRFRFISPLNMHSTTGIRLPLLFSMSLEEIFWLHYTKKGEAKKMYTERNESRPFAQWLAGNWLTNASICPWEFAICRFVLPAILAMSSIHRFFFFSILNNLFPRISFGKTNPNPRQTSSR